MFHVLIFIILLDHVLDMYDLLCTQINLNPYEFTCNKNRLTNFLFNMEKFQHIMSYSKDGHV